MPYVTTEYGNIGLDDFAAALGAAASQCAEDVRDVAWKILKDLHYRGAVQVAYELGKKGDYPLYMEQAVLRVLAMHASGNGIIHTPWGRACPYQIERWGRDHLSRGKKEDLLKPGEKGRIRKLENWCANLRRPNGPGNHDGLPKELEETIIQKIKFGHFAC